MAHSLPRSDCQWSLLLAGNKLRRQLYLSFLVPAAHQFESRPVWVSHRLFFRIQLLNWHTKPHLSSVVIIALLISLPLYKRIIGYSFLLAKNHGALFVMWLSSQMCLSLNSFKVFSFISICLICALLWALQSMTALYQYLEATDGSYTKKFVLENLSNDWEFVGISSGFRISTDQLALPQIMICSKLPYTHAGLDAFGDAMDQDFVLQHFREWLDPSMYQSPDYTSLPAADKRIAETTITQVIKCFWFSYYFKLNIKIVDRDYFK